MNDIVQLGYKLSISGKVKRGEIDKLIYLLTNMPGNHITNIDDRAKDIIVTLCLNAGEPIIEDMLDNRMNALMFAQGLHNGNCDYTTRKLKGIH